jgi:hypothetical protein
MDCAADTQHERYRINPAMLWQFRAVFSRVLSSWTIILLGSYAGPIAQADLCLRAADSVRAGQTARSVHFSRFPELPPGRYV